MSTSQTQPAAALQLLRPSDAAALLRVGRSKIYALLSSGEIPRVLIGSDVRVKLADLEDYITRQTEQSRNAALKLLKKKP